MVREEEDKQYLIYFVSRVLQGAKTSYSEIEKVALAFVTGARRWQPYFLSHPIIIWTNYPLTTILGRMDTLGRLVKWPIELAKLVIFYDPQIRIQVHAITDFIQEIIQKKEERIWEVYVDGSAMKHGSGSGAGVVLLSPKKDELNLAIKL